MGYYQIMGLSLWGYTVVIIIFLWLTITTHFPWRQTVITRFPRQLTDSCCFLLSHAIKTHTHTCTHRAKAFNVNSEDTSYILPVIDRHMGASLLVNVYIYAIEDLCASLKTVVCNTVIHNFCMSVEWLHYKFTTKIKYIKCVKYILSFSYICNSFGNQSISWNKSENKMCVWQCV